jgi:hypothetical protein
MNKQIQERSQTKARWSVTTANTIPSFGLDKKAQKVNVSPIDVSKRIDEYLRLSSIVTKFDSANAVATCKTNNFLHFQIFLYEGPEGSTYVEVVKLKGCGFSFMKERENIINAVEQKVLQKEDNLKCFDMSIPPSFLDSYEPPSQKDLEAMLVRASDRLHSSNREDVIFILENLSSFTKVTTTADRFSQENGHRMSILIIQHRGNIRDMILSIYIANEPSMMDGDETSERICIACLSILTNGIKSIYDKNQSDFLDHECKDFIGRLVPSLVRAAANYENNIENACIALACLRTLACNSSIGCEKVKETDILTIAEKAKVYGCREHLRLENVANAAIETLVQIS